MSLRQFLLQAGIPRVFSDLLVHFILSYLDGTPPHTDMALAQETYQSQMAIGQNLLLRGYLSIEWLHLLRHMGHDRPENAIVNIIFHIWHKFF